MTEYFWEIIENDYQRSVNLVSTIICFIKIASKEDKKASYFIYEAIDVAIFVRISLLQIKHEIKNIYIGEGKVKDIKTSINDGVWKC